ncbi:MAG: sulfide dehydrogenase [Alphaproteobacteria bacterium]|nr:sulfide dehydrogenase [Alphaproteobacteria bacterium]
MLPCSRLSVLFTFMLPFKRSTPAVLAGSCSTCHGPGGQSPGTMPSLAGLEAKYIMTRLKEFRSGEAPATVMNRIAKGYSDAEIDALGEYFTKTKR